MSMNKCLLRRLYCLLHDCRVVQGVVLLCFISILSGCSLSSDYSDDTSDLSAEYVVLPEAQDLVYTVSDDGELLDDIVLWYTMDVSNSPAILRINDLKTDSFLKRGQLVRIPKYMLRRVEPYVSQR